MIKKTIIFTFLSLFFVSCMYDIDFSEKVTSIPVVNCVLTNDTIQYLSLTKSSVKVGVYTFKEITNADIKLYGNDTLIGNFSYVSTKKWALKYTPVAGVKYKLMVNIADSITLWATTTMPVRNLVGTKRNADKYPTKNLVQYSARLPSWITIIRSYSPIFPDTKPSGKDYAFSEIGTNHPLSDKLNQSGNMASLVDSATTPKYDYYIRLKSDTTVNMKNPIPFILEAKYGDATYISFITLSEEFDKYLRTSLQKIILRRDVNDPVVLFDESSVYSNIVNGTGIFAAYSEVLIKYNDKIIIVLP